MTTIVRIDPPIEVDTPRGRGVAIFLLDYATDANLCWIVNMADTGECWTFKNPDIRFAWCETTGTGRRPEMPPPWEEIGQKVSVTDEIAQMQRDAAKAQEEAMRAWSRPAFPNANSK